MFNVEAESLGIFALTVMFSCITYAGFKAGLQLFFDGHLRFGALLPVIANLHGDTAFLFFSVAAPKLPRIDALYKTSTVSSFQLL
jgi:hypothetical protein